MQLIDTQLAEYNRLIALAQTLEQPQIAEVINEAKSRTNCTKRKYADLITIEVLSDSDTDGDNEKTTEATPFNPTRVKPTDKKDYEAAMKFVAEFKKEREVRGKRMDWISCLREGKDKLKYKNADSLRIQFIKYNKKQISTLILLFFCY